MLKHIHIQEGELTYKQRIALGELFMSEETYEDKFKETFHILHEIELDFSNNEEMKMFAEYFQEVIDGLQYWINKEKELLDYQPEPEEIRAGIRELGEKISYYGTLKTLAKNYAQDPDKVLRWKYGKVFGILYTDLEEFKYQKRLNKEYEKKYKN
ncbi:MAG: hypothetical protein FWF52_01205 [Candidatus Azobacteroides sp.]|nr:hypothetical protein [Candidatus Azobacteroides sp.]